MTGDCHVGICGSRGVRFPPATRPRYAAVSGAGGIQGSPLKRRMRASMAGTSFLRVVDR